MPPAEPSTDAAARIKPKRRVDKLGWIGLGLSLAALLGAVLSPWVVDWLEPDPKPIDQVAVDVAVKVKERLSAKLNGQESGTVVQRSSNSWSTTYPASVVGLGAIAVCLGIVGFVGRLDPRVSSATVAIGASAILFQYFLLLAGAVLVILLVGIVIYALVGGGFDF